MVKDLALPTTDKKKKNNTRSQGLVSLNNLRKDKIQKRSLFLPPKVNLDQKPKSKIIIIEFHSQSRKKSQRAKIKKFKRTIKKFKNRIKL